MGVALGGWLMQLLVEAQTARNAIYPDLVDCPVIILTAMALSTSLDQLLMLEDSPLAPALVALAVSWPMPCHRSRKGAEWLDGPETQAQGTTQREIEILRDQLSSALPDIVQIRKRMHTQAGVRLDRRLRGHTVHPRVVVLRHLR